MLVPSYPKPSCCTQAAEEQSLGPPNTHPTWMLIHAGMVRQRTGYSLRWLGFTFRLNTDLLRRQATLGLKVLVSL